MGMKQGEDGKRLLSDFYTKAAAGMICLCSSARSLCKQLISLHFTAANSGLNLAVFLSSRH